MRFTVPLDWRGVGQFDRIVLQALRRVPYGCLVAYKDLAEAIGKPKAARAVGQAVRRNRWPIIVPCHRVVAREGALGGFAGGLEMKLRLLRLEGITGLQSPKVRRVEPQSAMQKTRGRRRNGKCNMQNGKSRGAPGREKRGSDFAF